MARTTKPTAPGESKPPGRPRRTADALPDALTLRAANLAEESHRTAEALAEARRLADGIRADLRALADEREQAWRELHALRRLAREAQTAVLREAEQSAAQVRRTCDAALRLLAELRQAFHTAGQEVVGEFAAPLGQMRRTLAEASQLFDALWRQAEQARRQLDELTRRPEESPTEGRNRLGLTVGPAVVVAEVEAGSAAEAAGLRRGDVIAAANGAAVLTAADLRDAVRALPAGGAVALVASRGGLHREFQAVVPAAEGEPAEGRNRLGLTVGPGLVVSEVAPGSPAEAAGLERGDLIVSANGAAVQTGEQLRQAVAALPEGATVALRLGRDGGERDVTVALEAAAPPSPNLHE